MVRCWPLSVTFILLVGFILGAGQPVPGATLPNAPGYLITDLGSLGGGVTVPVAINVRADVVGYSTTTAGEVHAFLLPIDGPMRDLGALGGNASYATGLNNRGDVVGYSTTATGQVHAFLLLDSQIVDLGTGNSATGINDLGQVLVVSDSGGGKISSILGPYGQAVPLGTLGGSSAIAGGLNNLGQVVGSSTAADGTNHAFAYDLLLRKLIDLGDIGATGSMADLNEIGEAVGTRLTTRGARVAFAANLGKESEFIEDMTVRRGFAGTIAYGINNEGTAVGAGELTNPSVTNAGRWTPDGDFLNLNEALIANSGWTMLSATAINDAGVIVGRALSPAGQPIAYLLTVPGPDLSVEKAMGIARSLDAVVDVLQRGAAAAATAATPSPVATALIDLQQAQRLLTPAAGQTAVGGVGTGQASRLLASVGRLLSLPTEKLFLPAADRESALAITTAARSGLQ